MRAALLLLVCGCQGVFGLRHVEMQPAADAAGDAAMSGLVAYYPMDDLGTIDACMADAAGGPSGRCNNGMPALVPTIHGKGYLFDGAASITVVGAPVPDPAPPFTVTVWISVATPLGVELQCAANRVYGGAGDDSWQFCVSSSTILYGAGTNGVFGDGSVLTVGTWHQLALTYDGTMIQAYLDGVPGGTAASTVSFDAQPMVLGLDLDAAAPAARYKQIVDELAIYNRVLTPTELAQLYQM